MYPCCYKKILLLCTDCLPLSNLIWICLSINTWSLLTFFTISISYCACVMNTWMCCYTHTHIHKHSNFLMYDLWLALARPNYCIIILFLHDYVGQDKPLTLNEMIKIAQFYQQHQCKFIISARKSHHL